MKKLILTGMLAMALFPAQAHADSMFDGTWKIDMNSVHLPKKPDMFLLKDGMYECKTCTPAIQIKADGQDQSVTGHPYFDTVAVKVVDDHTIQETDKKNGKVVTTSTTTVAPDGKTASFEFTDSSASNAQPITGKGTSMRVAEGPAGSHAISGSWRVSSFSNYSDNGLAVTYKSNGDNMTMTNPTGQTYTAKMDGTEAPMSGDPGITNVSVRMMGKRTLVETDKRSGKTIGVMKATVSADGKTMMASYHNDLQGRTTSWRAMKE